MNSQPKYAIVRSRRAGEPTLPAEQYIGLYDDREAAARGLENLMRATGRANYRIQRLEGMTQWDSEESLAGLARFSVAAASDRPDGLMTKD